MLRAFFAERGVLEVETPLLATAPTTAPHLDSFVTRYAGPQGRPLYLQTSPEFAMKRLLAAGSGPIYQIGKAFRNGEAGGRHNPEFTLLEWYRPGYGQHALMDEVEALVTPLLGRAVSAAPERIRYGAAFQRYTGLDPHTASCSELRARALAHGISLTDGVDEPNRGLWLDVLLSHLVEPQLGQGRLCFLYDYPASQAALAVVRHDSSGPPVAERFELYLNGMELASGYHELGDSAEQRKRFEHDRRERGRLGLDQDIPLDEHLLAALTAGLPDCAGVALGVDRLVMLALGASHIGEVIGFPLARA